MPPGPAAPAAAAPEAAEVSLAHVAAHAPPEDAGSGAVDAAGVAPHVISPPPPPLERLSRGQWVTAWLYVFVLSGVYSQQNLLAPNLTAIQHEFHFTPEERDKKLGGAIAMAVFVTAACCALLAGALGDVLSRRPLIVFFVLLSMSATLGTAWVRSYNQLVALRAVAGVALGTVPPLVYSALADIFPATRRNVAAGLVTISSTAGTLVGQIISGYVGVSGWRKPFVILAVPCMFLTLLLPFVARDPSRGGAEPELRKRILAAAAAIASRATGRGGAGAAGRGASHDGATPLSIEYGERLELGKLARVFAVPTNLFIFAQSVPSCVPWGVLNTFITDYVAQNRGMGIVGATNAILVYAAGGLIGTLGGAALTQRLFNRAPRLVGIVVAVSTAAGIGPMLYIVRGSYSLGHFAPLGGAAFGAGILTCVAAPTLRGAILCVNSPETRGSAFAILIFLDSMGRGLGPLGAASLSARQGRMQAFTSAICLWAISAGFQFMLTFTLSRDVAVMEAGLRVAKLRGATHAFENGHDEAAPAGAEDEEQAAGMPRRGESTVELLENEEAEAASAAPKR